MNKSELEQKRNRLLHELETVDRDIEALEDIEDSIDVKANKSYIYNR